MRLCIGGARPRQGRRARSSSATAASTPASTRASRSSRRAASAWSWSTRRRTRSTPTCTSSRRSTCRHGVRRGRTAAAAPARRRRSRRARSSTTRPAPFTASFSSRGPLAAGGGDILKPDIIAPGQDILAAVAPPGNHGRDFDLYSGTSMSSPHIAGVARAAEAGAPRLVADGDQVGDDDDGVPGRTTTTPFDWGAGHVDPNKAVDPGLVYDSNLDRLARVPEGPEALHRSGRRRSTRAT